MSIIIHENTGWLKQNGQWIEEDDTSEDMDVILDTNTIKLTRVFSHPYMITQYLAAVSQTYYVSTGTMAGISETTSNTFTQWGEPVTIPEPF